MHAKFLRFFIIALLCLPLPAKAMSCAISYLPSGDMGVYNAGIDNIRGYAIYLSCAGGTGLAMLTAGPSQNTGSIENRLLKHESKADTLRYQLCLDGACKVIFGNSGNNIGTVTISNSIPTSFSFWVKVYGGVTQAAAGTYRDSVTITVTP